MNTLLRSCTALVLVTAPLVVATPVMAQTPKSAEPSADASKSEKLGADGSPDAPKGETAGSSTNAAAETDECAVKPNVCGRREFKAGVKAYRKGDFQAARGHFDAAQRYRPHPVVLFNLALAEVKLGETMSALNHFNDVIASGETPARIRKQATRQKEDLERTLGTIEVRAVGKRVEVYVDEQPVEGDPPRLRVAEGEHSVRVVVDGKERINRSVTVSSGERLQLSVDRSEEVVLQPKRDRSPPPPAPPPPAADGLPPAVFIGGIGLTVVATGAFVWSALDTQSAFDDYEAELPRLNQQQADQRVDDGNSKELRTNILLGASAVLGAGTAVVGIFFTDWSGGSVSVGVGPGQAQLRGRF